MTTTRNRLAQGAAVACIGLALAVSAPGCAKDDQSGNGGKSPATGTRTDVTPPKLSPADVENAQSAKEKLRQADEAEGRGDYARAIEALESLRDYPEDARPKDLDHRITHLREKMKTPAGQ